MPDEEFTVRLDSIDAALIGTNNAIPGNSIEEKLVWMISDELRRLAEQAAMGREFNQLVS